MNDTQVKQRINQLLSFIRQEADEKANEIRVKAEEDFNIRKLSAVESAREKIRVDYERKMKQIAVNQKIAYSTANNESRLQVLKYRESLMQEIYDEASSLLEKLSQDPKKLKEMLKGFSIQGLETLGDDEAVLITKKDCVAVLKELLPEIAAGYEKATGKKVELTVSDSEHLPAESIGGVVITTEGGKIRLENTFESRLEICYQQNLPYFRETLGFNDE